MKIISSLLLLITLCGCSASFKSSMEKASKQFEVKNFIDVIDTINLALPKWKESDGKETKAQAFQLLGKSYHEIRKFDNAAEAFKQAIQLSDNTFDAAYDLGIIYQTAQDYPGALNAYRDALRMKKDDPMALIGLGNAYFGMRDYKNAKQMYERVLETSPGVQDALKYISLANQKLSHRSAPAPTKKAIHPASKKKPAPKAPAKKKKR